jgi:hypothetical protein
MTFACCCCGVLQRVATEISVLQSIKHPLLPTLHQVYTTGDNIFMEMTVRSFHLLRVRSSSIAGTLYACITLALRCCYSLVPSTGMLHRCVGLQRAQKSTESERNCKAVCQPDALCAVLLLYFVTAAVQQGHAVA